jgi:hypothetical protein
MTLLAILLAAVTGLSCWGVGYVQGRDAERARQDDLADVRRERWMALGRRRALIGRAQHSTSTAGHFDADSNVIELPVRRTGPQPA